MPYAIRTVFDSAKPELRTQYRPAHIAFLKENIAKLIAAGPLMKDDGSPYGGLTIVDTDSRAEAQAFAAADPFAKCGFVKETSIRKWAKVFLDAKEIG